VTAIQPPTDKIILLTNTPRLARSITFFILLLTKYPTPIPKIITDGCGFVDYLYTVFTTQPPAVCECG
jgi:hypothetical protein